MLCDSYGDLFAVVGLLWGCIRGGGDPYDLMCCGTCRCELGLCIGVRC